MVTWVKAGRPMAPEMSFGAPVPGTTGRRQKAPDSWRQNVWRQQARIQSRRLVRPFGQPHFEPRTRQ